MSDFSATEPSTPENSMADSVINLLVVDDSLTNIDAMVKALRSGGHVVEPLHTNKESEIHDIIKYKPLDLILVCQSEQLPSVASVRKQITANNKDIPLLVATSDATPANIVGLLQQGADNVFFPDPPEHLAITATKELNSFQVLHQLGSYEIRLNETESRSRALLDSSRDAIAYIHEGAHIYANPVYLEMFGYASEEELEGVTLMNMVVRKDQNKLKTALRNSMRKGTPDKPVELTALHSSGSEFPVTMQCIPTHINAEPCLQILIHSPSLSQEQQREYELLDKKNQDLEKKNQDLEKRVKTYEKQLKEFSSQDELTRVYNRKYFTDYLKDLCRASEATSGAVYYILLSDYRSLSESVGLEGIDLLLQDLAKVLKKTISRKELLSHFSDAVFTIYTPLSTNDAVLKLGAKISTSIKDHVSSGTKKLISTSSAIGICMLKEYHNDPAQILNQADRACDEARQKGNNQVVLYRPKAGGVADDDAKVELILDAFAAKRMRVCYQPIASFQDGEERRFKAYAQLLDAQQQPLDLKQLGPIAERHGLMGRIDKWLLNSCMEALSNAAPQHGSSPPSLFVRLSTNSIANEHFVKWFSELVQKAKLHKEALVIEFTEDDAEAHFKESKEFRDNAKSLGCGFALSHFGGKDNSERIMKHFAPDYIKLDIELIEQLSKDKDTRQTMLELTELTQEMNIRVIASDIASAPQMANIWQYGVTLVQGDMVAEPSTQMEFDFQDFAG